MINKLKLQSLISKYHLGGMNNQVKWRIKDNTLVIYAGTSGKVCRVQLDNFEFEDAELGIFDTNKLNKLLSITNGDLTLGVEKMKSIFTKLLISDPNYDLVYTLADTLVIGNTSYYEDPETFDAIIPLTEENINHLIKAKNALGDMNKMVINTTKNLDGDRICEFILGDESGFSNKVSYIVQGEINKDNLNIPFNSDIFRDILASNKDMNGGMLRISELGMVKFNFEKDDIKSEYFLIRNE